MKNPEKLSLGPRNRLSNMQQTHVNPHLSGFDARGWCDYEVRS